MPFNWENRDFTRDPVAVDAIPDIGENQQIVATEWNGPFSKNPRSGNLPANNCFAGYSWCANCAKNLHVGMCLSIYFKDNVDFYWSRSRILEKLNSLPTGTLLRGATPWGPECHSTGQYTGITLEGRDPKQ